MLFAILGGCMAERFRVFRVFRVFTAFRVQGFEFTIGVGIDGILRPFI